MEINEDFLLLLISNNGVIDISSLNIYKHFELETKTLQLLCKGNNDNISDIINFINLDLKPKLPNQIFKFCKQLDKPYQSVNVNINMGIQDITDKKELIYANQKLALDTHEKFDFEENITNLKKQIREKIELWFKVFDIEFAYEKAKHVPNMLLYSHRISGWSSPEYKITENLKQEVKTNFGYGSVSYFYSILTFKNIQITPFSEWVDYKHSNFSEIIRYTKSFRRRKPIEDKRGRLRYYELKIENEYWKYALNFTKNAANLLLTNENEFIDKYIISECEAMVNRLEEFYIKNEYEFIDENQIVNENEEFKKYKVNLKGFELIDFRTEKIIGALDFINKINEYNSIVSTKQYTTRIISLNKKFIPNVFITLDNQNEELKKAKENYNIFITKHNQVVEKKRFYENEKVKLKNEFDLKYKDEFSNFTEVLKKSFEDLKQQQYKVILHTENIKKLNEFIDKYNQTVKNNCI